jgi:hypothetical protein
MQQGVPLVDRTAAGIKSRPAVETPPGARPTKQFLLPPPRSARIITPAVAAAPTGLTEPISATISPSPVRI